MDINLILFLAVFIWLGIITFFLIKILRTFSKLTKGISEKDLRAVLEEVLKKIGEQDKVAGLLKQEIEKLQKEKIEYFQNIGLIRYNPFSETGGNQSFVLALLDAKGSGLVMTTLHSREATRVFAKPVKEGKETGYEFSKEEIQAILIAQKGSGKKFEK